MAKQRDQSVIKAELAAHGGEDEVLHDEPLGFTEDIDINAEYLKELDQLHADVMAGLDTFHHRLVYDTVVDELGFDPLVAMA